MNHIHRHGRFITRYLQHQLGLLEPLVSKPSESELSRIELCVKNVIREEENSDRAHLRSVPIFKKTFYYFICIKINCQLRF